MNRLEGLNSGGKRKFDKNLVSLCSYMIEVPKVSGKYPQKWRELSDDVDEILGAMGASWYQDFPNNLHRISSNPEISEPLRDAIQSYKEFRRNRFEDRLEKKNTSYSAEQDTLLTEVREYLDNNAEVRRAEVQDAYGTEELPEERVLLPRDERDIIAVLEDGIEIETLFEAGESLGLEPSRVFEDADPGDLGYGDEHIAVILPDTHEPPETRTGMSASIYPDDDIYIIGGANSSREGVTNREPGTAYQPFHQGEASWNLKLFDSYLQKL